MSQDRLLGAARFPRPGLTAVGTAALIALEAIIMSKESVEDPVLCDLSWKKRVRLIPRSTAVESQQDVPARLL